MANRRLFQFRYSFERDIVELIAKVTIAGAGACTLTEGKGIASITRNSAGNYSILLQDNYNMLLDVTGQSISGSSAQAAPIMTVVSETVSSTKIVRLQYRAIDNSTATDPASGEVLLIRIACRNAST